MADIPEASITETSVPLTAEKLALMKLEARDFFSEPSSPTLLHKTLSNNGFDSSRSVAGARSSSRQFSRSTRRSSSFINNHKAQMSLELTASAESKFFALVELLSSASREASSLKEVWGKISSERESITEEREELMEQVIEATQELERQQAYHQRHGVDSIENKKKVEKLLLDLSIAVEGVSVEKKRVAERDHHLGNVRRELGEARETITRHTTEIDRVRNDHESLILNLRTTEGDRDSARDEVERVRRELNKLIRERTDISSRLTEVTAKYESAHREVLSLTDRIKMYDLEREEQLLEVDRLKEEIRKSKIRVEESVKELNDVTERHDRIHRESLKLKETIRNYESETTELSHQIEHLKRENKTLFANFTESEDRHSEVSLKYEHIKRELLSTKDRLREVELEKNEALETVERVRETHRTIIIERDELKEAVTSAERKAHDAQRRITALEESLRRSETTLTDTRAEVTTLTSRVKHLTQERDDARDKHGHYTLEITSLKEKLIHLQAEITSITDSRDRIRGELETSRAEFEEIIETTTQENSGFSELEFEIESLRTLLHEAREQKEHAIHARNTADRERDEAISRYESKVRELERFEESAAQHYHASAAASHAEGRTSTTSRRVLSSHSNATQVDSSSSG